MRHCPFCITTRVDWACARTGIKLTNLERQRLVAALLSRQHLILSGPAGLGKRRLASALALSIADGQQSHVCLIQGHPWWAARTGDIARFVNLQTEFSVWRLIYFIESALHGQQPPARIRAGGNAADYVAFVERMSPVEIDFYFGVFPQGLLRGAPDQASAVSLRLIGTYDSSRPPDLDHRILRLAALVHLSGTPVETPV